MIGVISKYFGTVQYNHQNLSIKIEARTLNMYILERYGIGTLANLNQALMK